MEISVSQAVIEAAKLLLAFLLGLGGKLLYDRRFTKRPDLRFAAERPATFGDRRYQNFEVVNNGTEAATDVRVAFRRQSFDLTEHQVQFDGDMKLETTDDYVIYRIPSLLPDDRLLFSFVFVPDKAGIQGADEMVQSVRASNCLGRSQLGTRRRASTVGQVANVVVASVLAVAVLWFTWTVFAEVFEIGGIAAMETRGPYTLTAGAEATVEVVVTNRSADPLSGTVSLTLPWDVLAGSRAIRIAGNGSQEVALSFKIPEKTPPGVYLAEIQLSARARGKLVRRSASSEINVK